MDPKDYTNLLGALADGTCAIILGPEFYLLNANEENKIRSHSDIIHSDCLKTSKYLAEDGFFYSDENDETEETFILREICTYYRNLDVPEYYDLLAELPFYLAISLSPDDLLVKAMNTKKRNYNFVHYKKGSGLYEKKMDVDQWEKIEELSSSPRTKQPLVFNFQGTYDDFQSLIFTYDSLFNFLFSIFHERKLPDNLRAEISKASTFLFLGFGYERWYLKIIFFILEKLTYGRREKKAIFNFSHRHNKMVEFYKNKFKLKFFKESTVTFLQTLYNDCANRKILQPKEFSKDPQLPLNRKYKILYFTSNYDQLKPLASEDDFKNIKKIYTGKPNRDEFEMPEWHPSVTQTEMFNRINEAKPNLVVIFMHGSQEKGLLFKGENGDEEPFALEKFIRSIRVLTQHPFNRLECIVFCCCHSSPFAEKILAYVPYAIGVEGPIQDEAMSVFNDGFFNTLFDDKLINPAFNTGIDRVTNEDNLKRNAELLRIYSSSKIEEPANV